MVGPVRALVDPCAQEPDLLSRETVALLRHDFVLNKSRHEMNQRAVRAFIWNDGQARITPGQRLFLYVETEFSLLLLRPMAGIAVLNEQRLNVFLKINR